LVCQVVYQVVCQVVCQAVCQVVCQVVCQAEFVLPESTGVARAGTQSPARERGVKWAKQVRV